MTARLRMYFANERILEVDTPALGRAAASDVQIESFEVHSSLSSAPLYLHTSPEFFMKRLLAAGYPDIYSICRVYRDGESGRQHQPEFTMVEWYRHGFDLSDMIDDTVHAIAAALDDVTLAQNIRRIDYYDAMISLAGVDPDAATIAELAQAAGADDGLQSALGNSRDDWLDLLVTSKLAPAFAKHELTVLQHYPASQAALARLCPANPDVADRFEVFLGEVEIANGYVELTDPVDQAERIALDQAARQGRGKKVRCEDQALLAALQHGLPSCAGVAMGLERLQMLHDNTDDIRNVVTFTFEDS